MHRNEIPQKLRFSSEAVFVDVDSEMTIRISGNNIKLSPSAPFVGAREHQASVPVYTNHFYETFEQFCRNAGDFLRVGLFTVSGSERVVAIYDSRKPFLPRASDAMPAKVWALVNAIADGEELVDEENRLVEWRQGGNFGWFWNLDCDYCSEWGYGSMFPVAGESQEELQDRNKKNYDAMIQALGGEENVFVVDGPEIKIVKGVIA